MHVQQRSGSGDLHILLKHHIKLPNLLAAHRLRLLLDLFVKRLLGLVVLRALAICSCGGCLILVLELQILLLLTLACFSRGASASSVSRRSSFSTLTLPPSSSYCFFFICSFFFYLCLFFFSFLLTALLLSSSVVPLPLPLKDLGSIRTAAEERALISGG